MDVWDTHLIRPSSNEHVPHGRPNVMYMTPELYDTQDYLCAVSANDVRLCKEDSVFRRAILCDDDVYELCLEIMQIRNLSLPSDVYQGVNLYMELRECMFQILL